MFFAQKMGFLVKNIFFCILGASLSVDMSTMQTDDLLKSKKSVKNTLKMFFSNFDLTTHFPGRGQKNEQQNIYFFYRFYKC
jgi:hypothetical protein